MYSKFFSPHPTLYTSRLKLRLVKRSDAYELYDFCKRPETSKFAKWEPHSSLYDTKQYINWKLSQHRKAKCTSFIVTDKNDNNILGTCSYVNLDLNSKSAEIGYSIRSECWGNGYAPEAASALIWYGFEIMKLQRIYARVVAENVQSIRVLEKLGMEYEGTHKKEYYFNGKTADIKVYAMTDDAYFKGVKYSEI